MSLSPSTHKNSEILMLFSRGGRATQVCKPPHGAHLQPLKIVMHLLYRRPGRVHCIHSSCSRVHTGQLGEVERPFLAGPWEVQRGSRESSSGHLRDAWPTESHVNTCVRNDAARQVYLTRTP
eukprot:2503732-Pyramimonas_sp.AAC.1